MCEDFYISSTPVVVKDRIAIFFRIKADFPDPVSILLITISNPFCSVPKVVCGWLSTNYALGGIFNTSEGDTGSVEKVITLCSGYSLPSRFKASRNQGAPKLWFYYDCPYLKCRNGRNMKGA